MMYLFFIQAKKAVLKWDNQGCPEVAPCAGDVLEVKYDGKEADGTLKFEVLAVKGTPDHDEGLSDEEKSEEQLSDDVQTPNAEQVNNGSSAPIEDSSEVETFPASEDHIPG